MRLITWNCRVGAFREKAAHVARYRPDVLVVQEVEPIDDVLLFSGEDQPTCRDRITDVAFPRRAIGVFSYTDTMIEPVDLAEPLHGFRRFRARTGDLDVQIVGIWTSQTNSRETSYMQAHDGIRRHADWIRERPTVILGDFNNNASFDGASWRELLDLLEPLQLVSAYHRYFSEPFGAETRPTHFHKGKEHAPFHLDYCFLPEAWSSHIRSVEVGKFGDWHAISDHAPLIVDVVP